MSDMTTDPVSHYVATLAQRHGVTSYKTGHDALAEMITHLSDDDAQTDETQILLVALGRAHVIDGPTFVELLSRHLDECRPV